MRRVASINRTAGRGILSAASGRKPRIPVVRLFVTREREREREHTKVSITSNTITQGKKKTKKFKIIHAIIHKIELNIPQSSSLRSTSSKIPRTSSAALSRARKRIYSFLLPFPFSSSSFLCSVNDDDDPYTNEENNSSFCCWCCFFFFRKKQKNVQKSRPRAKKRQNFYTIHTPVKDGAK